jgi:hypothetical protein
MQAVMFLLVGWLLGAALCAMLARAIIRRYRLPWRATLMYFGLVPYPDEALLPRIARARPRPERG